MIRSSCRHALIGVLFACMVLFSATTPSFAHGGGHGGGGGFHGGFGGGHAGGGGFQGGWGGGGYSHVGGWGGAFAGQGHHSNWAPQSQHTGFTNQAAGHNGFVQGQHTGGSQHQSISSHHVPSNVVSNHVNSNASVSHPHPNTISSGLRANTIQRASSSSISTPKANSVPTNHHLASSMKNHVNTSSSGTKASVTHPSTGSKNGSASRNHALAQNLRDAQRPTKNGGASRNRDHHHHHHHHHDDPGDLNGGLIALGGCDDGNPGCPGGIPVDGSVPVGIVCSDCDPSLVAGQGDPGAFYDSSQAAQLVLVNPTDSPGTVNYTLDGAANALDIGTSQTASGSGSWLVEFDRGIGGAQASYSLAAGTYTFRMTDLGWDLCNATDASIAASSAAVADTAAPVASFADPASAAAPAPEPAVAPAAPDGSDDAASHRLVVQNPAGSPGPINYVLDGTSYTLAAGSTQELSISAPCVIEFDRGVGGAEGRFTLAAGSYRFGIGDQGWDLYSTTYDVTLDNTANGQEFHYLRDGRDETVPAGGTRKISDSYPIKVSFDPGNGGAVAARSLDRTDTTYRIALRPNSDVLDLIPAPGK
jgi:hypothetical protein